MSVGLVSIAFLVAAPPVTGGLQKGDAFTFTGSVAEAVERPERRFRRNYELELRLLVLERVEQWADVAVLTRMKRIDDPVVGATGAVTGGALRKGAPPLIRVDLIRVHAEGAVHLLAPERSIPLRLEADTPARALPLLPLDGAALSEFGVFPPRPSVGMPTEPWTVAVGPTRPGEVWQVKGTEFVNAERCRHLVVNQQSADWVKPASGGLAWHRAEAVWVSTQDGTARRVHRVILQRDGRPENPPVAWVETKYAFQEQSKLTRLTFDRARLDFEMVYLALADAATPLGARQFDLRLAKLDAHLETSDAAGAVRDALLAARSALTAAKNGEPLLAQPETPLLPSVESKPKPWPQPGDAALDFRTGGFRFADHRGKPVVLVFYKPNGETSELSLAVADALAKRYGNTVAVVPLVAAGELADANSERDRLKIAVTLYDGRAAARDYGVESAPRIALIDGAGVVRWTFTGIGAETGFLAREEIDRLVHPAPPNIPAGKSVPPGVLAVPIVPPP